MKIDKVAGGHVPQTNFQQASKKPVETMEQTKVSEPRFKQTQQQLIVPKQK